MPDKEKNYAEIPATAEYAEVKVGEDGVTETTLENLSNNRGDDEDV